MPRTTVISLDDPGYPPALAHLHDPPGKLYTCGKARLLTKPSVAIVGSRKASHYGQRCTTLIAGGLARAGAIIISGLAYGVDSWAHRAALDAGGVTVAVLASGLEVPLPAWQSELAREIIDRGGCLVTEQPPTMPARKHHFLLRNRIIAGVSLGTVVVEAADKSGALVTANYALEANRCVFAVPGDVDRETSVGTNRLLKQGAAVVRDAADVIAELQGQLPGSANSSGNASALNLLSSAPRSVEEVALALSISIPDALATLSQMELDGQVVRGPDGRFSNTT